MYLKNDSIAFVDRKNSCLLVTDTSKESIKEFDLRERFPEEYRAKCEPDNIPRPSDVNKGFEEDQILITYTGDKYAVAVAYTWERDTLSQPLQCVRINDRTRSVVALDANTVCATTEYYIIVKNKNDNDDVDVKRHERSQRDRGGLLMTDGRGNIYYGDGDSFVGCYWDGTNIIERFRLSGMMKHPRGSAVQTSTRRIYICTDSSRAIFSISVNGDDVKKEFSDRLRQYGDIDFNSKGNNFFTTFWEENEWPILYEIRS